MIEHLNAAEKAAKREALMWSIAHYRLLISLAEDAMADLRRPVLIEETSERKVNK